jgi:hypothetical protein
MQQQEKPVAWVTVRANGRISYTQNPPRRQYFGDSSEPLYRRPTDERVARLLSAAEALGVIGNGYCFCDQNRDPDKADHVPECHELRAAIDGVREVINGA